MIKPYTAVGLIPTVRGIRKRKDIKVNLEHLHHLVKAASWLSEGLHAGFPAVQGPDGDLGASVVAGPLGEGIAGTREVETGPAQLRFLRYRHQRAHHRRAVQPARQDRDPTDSL